MTLPKMKVNIAPPIPPLATLLTILPIFNPAPAVGSAAPNPKYCPTNDAFFGLI